LEIILTPGEIGLEATEGLEENRAAQGEGGRWSPF